MMRLNLVNPSGKLVLKTNASFPNVVLSNNQEKTITPTKAIQEIVPDYGYDSLSKVTVEAIPDEYIIPEGTKDISSNGVYDVKEFANANVNIPDKKLGTKNITQNGTYKATDDGLDGYSEVEVSVVPASDSIVSFDNFDSRGYPQKAIINKYTTYTDTNKVWDYLLYTSSSQVSEYGNFMLKLKEIIIPNEVTEIGQAVFQGLINLTNINLPNGLKKLGNSALRDCQKLNFDSLPNGLTSIDNYTFYSCYELTLKELPPNLTRIGNSAFQHCKKLALKEIPNTVTFIDMYAFAGCTNLPLEKLPDNLVQLGNSVLNNCANLKMKKLPTNMTTLSGSYAFDSCTSLTEMEMPASIKTLTGSRIFYNCTNLKKVKFHLLANSSNCKIQSEMFSRCSSLITVLLGEIDFVLPLANVNAFASTPIANGTGYIYVKDELVDSYKTANNWSTYANQIKGISEYVEE